MKDVAKGKGRAGKRRAFKTVISLVVVVALVGGGFWIWQGRQAAKSVATTNTVVELTTGDLSKTVSGTGSLTLADTSDISYGFDITLKETKVEAGQQVAEGDVLASVDQQALGQVISNLTGELSQLESQVAQMAKSYDTTQKLRSTAAGRVKAIYAAEGDDAAQVVAANGGLALLSLDGKLTVQIPAGTLVKGDTVTVTQGDTTYDGTVESLQNDQATVTFTDNGPTLTDEVSVTDEDGNALGSGTPAVHMALLVGTDAEGTISEVYTSLNSKISSSTSLFYLEDIPVSNDYMLALAQRDEKAQQLLQAKQLSQTGEITAPEDGIVKSVSDAAANGGTVAANGTLATLYVGNRMKMTVSVDELDILNVKVGQTADLVMDALEDQSYEAEVSEISEIGTSSSGVTTYQVTLSLEGDDQLKMGMNGTATIVVEERSGVVLVPLMALQSSKDGQYVWLYNGSTDGDEPGTKTVVTTGLSNDSYAEVTDGLEAGDKVVIVRTASTSGTGSFGMGGMMGGISGDQMPQGGNFSGGQGGERQEGAGSQGGQNAPGGGQQQAPAGN